MSTTSAGTPKKPSYESEPLSQTLKTMSKGVGKFIACIIGIGLVVTVGLVVYQAMDEDGYISHDRTLDVWMTGNWLAGENRVCFFAYRPIPMGSQPANWTVCNARRVTRRWKITTWPSHLKAS